MGVWWFMCGEGMGVWWFMTGTHCGGNQLLEVRQTRQKLRTKIVHGHLYRDRDEPSVRM